MSELWVTSVYNQEGTGAPNFPNGATVTGVITATSFSGSGANLTGIDATALKDDGGSVKIQANSDGAVVTGILTATSGTFTGPVTIGGTLTYEDVTNIDSVGVITARDGVKVTTGGVEVAAGGVTVTAGGVTVTAGGIEVAAGGATITGNIGLGGATYGSSGQVLTSGGSGANASWTTISSAPEVTSMTINGTVANEAPVVLRSDGSVEAITGNNDNITNSQASNDSNTQRGQVVYDPDNDKYVAFYRKGVVNGNSQCYARIGTLSGDGAQASGTLSWGSEITVTSYNVATIKAMYDTRVNRFVITYTGSSPNSSGTIYFRQVEINTAGTGLNVGTRRHPSSSYNSVYPNNFAITNKQDQYGRIAVVWMRGGMTYCVGVKPDESNIDDFAISSTEYFVNDSNGNYAPYDCVLEEHSWYQRHIVVMNGGGSNPNQGIVGSIYTHGANGAAVVFESSTRDQYNGNSEVQMAKLVYDPVNDWTVIIGRKNTGSQGYLWLVKTNSNSWTYGNGTSGSGLLFTGSDSIKDYTDLNECISGVYDPETGYIHIFWTRASDNKGMRSLYKINPAGGGTISEVIPTATIFDDTTTMIGQTSTYDSSAKRIALTYSIESTRKLNSVAFQPQSTNMTETNFLGFSAAAYTNGQTGTIKVVGNTTTQSGLTTGSKYYVQLGGTLATTPVVPSVYGGLALSATSLLIKG